MRKPLIFFLGFLIAVVHGSRSVNVDSDITFEDSPPDRGGSPWYGHILSRVKRQLDFFSGWGSSSSTTEETSTPTSTTSLPTTSARESRSPEEEEDEQDGEEDIGNSLPVGYSDDEDGGGGPEDTSGSGEAGPVSPTFLDGGDPPRRTLYRMTLLVEEVWDPDFSTKSSQKFVDFASKLQKDIDELFQYVPGVQTSDVIKIERSDATFVLVTIDLESIGNSNAKQLEERVRTEITSYRRIGAHTIKTDNFTFNQFKECVEGEMLCTESNICIPLSNRCDGSPQCPDAEDELGCGSASPASSSTSADTSTTSSFDFEPKSSSTTAETSHRSSEVRTGVVRTAVESRPHSTPDLESHHCRADDAVPKACPNTSRVICSNQFCDGKLDCPGGEDEIDCPTATACLTSEFSCDLSRCVATSKVCDGVPDCTDGTDEHNCKACSPDDVRCKNGTCISYMRRCDLIRDCPDGEDEDNCQCEGSQFRCDGKCLPASVRCNRVFDCADRSDESNCPGLKECGSEQWLCQEDGVCIDLSMRCDMHSDCTNGSDERDCQACPEGWFVCQNSHCIEMSKRCDGVTHCNDRSDEIGCPTGCRVDEFTCKDYSCVPNGAVCNNISDCADNSDEANCPSLGECLSNEFRCKNGVCISGSYVCDGLNDCTDGSDEQDCSNRSCAPGDFQCADGKCIRQEQKCDGRVDCSDGSDEEQSICRPTCQPNEWQCNTGECIPLEKRCDREFDCTDGSDERNNDCPVVTTQTPYVQCRSWEFTCSNYRDCVSKTQQCDGRVDCPDGSDEENCIFTPAPPPPPTPPFISCRPWEFKCWDGPCIPKDFHCDNKRDCSDGSDEENCAGIPLPELKVYERDQMIKESREAVFQCRDEGRGRYKVKWTREGGLPLPPGSRSIEGRLEMPNVQREHSGTYYCEAIGVPPTTYGARVSAHLTVEQLVLPTRPFDQACGPGEATCYNRECILKSQVCDGRYDCSDGSDESRCQNAQLCEPNEFRCSNRKCILKTWRCDKDDDCGDNSDEVDCEVRRPGSDCFETEYECKSRNQCIPKSFQCDGTNDCVDGSDEIGCYPMKIITTPVPSVNVPTGGTLVLTCTATGVPTPEITWRKDWRHVPSKCTQSSINGTGTLTCPNFQNEDCGAYTCEALNFKTYIISPRDTIACTEKSDVVACPSGTFQANGSCIKCFCFGITSDCLSADLYVFQLPPPVESFRIVNVYVTPNRIDVRRNEESYLQPTLRRITDGFSIQSSPQSYDYIYPYYALPERYHGSQLKSYGGYLTYTILVETRRGQPTDIPDIIITGNGQTLVYRHPGRIEDSYPTKISARLFENSNWHVLTEQEGERYARREDIMMTLVNVDNILLRTQYTDGQGVLTTISNIAMDSAQYSPADLGKAVFVEQCRCPPGYSGLSCESCDRNYIRTPPPPWLGECKPPSPPCPRGYYGDPSRNIPCEKCPCPLTTPPNQFSQDCYLDTDDRPTCRGCPTGHAGRRCEYCQSGYVGNPLVPGDYCRADTNVCDAAGSRTPSFGGAPCVCKANVVGPTCSECAPNTFHLSPAAQHGCISCFCMGITDQCTSSRLYRDQIVAVFARDKQEFELAPEDEISNFVPARIDQGYLAYDNFQPKVYYWILPRRFLGNQLASYGGSLTYTLRYVPNPGGSVSKNSAADVKLFSGNRVNLYHYSNATVEPDRDQRVTVPLLEQYWQREDGGVTDREHFLMALADLDSILIKATYTTTTQFANLQHVYLDTGTSRNTGRGLALEVEECRCPAGYTGLSCESCSPGHYKIEGLYLGLCERCDCNGRSEDCDMETGNCFNCRNNWSGAHCEVCPVGYTETEGRCVPPQACACDPRGVMTTNCPGGRCDCKVNVEGAYCDRCRPGTFNLSAENPLGCLDCYCSDVTRECQSSNLYFEQLPMQILDTSSSSGFVLTDRNGRVLVRDGFILNPSRNEIGYDINMSQGEYFWSLPPQFTGDRVTSYGGNLIFTRRFRFSRYAYIDSDYDVILNGVGKSIYWQNSEYPRSDHVDLVESVVVPLVEGQWRRTDPRTGHAFATRRDILEILSQLSSILIRASAGPDTVQSFLSDVALDVAIDQRSNRPALGVEVCRCPETYRGTSCQQCIDHYYRAYDNTCKRCDCNDHEESCSLGSDNELHCVCQQGYFGKRCEQMDSPMMVHLSPGGHIRPTWGTHILFKCHYMASEPVHAIIQRVHESSSMGSISYGFNNQPPDSASTPPGLRNVPAMYKGEVEERILIEKDLKTVDCTVYNTNGETLGLSRAFINGQDYTPGNATQPIPPTITVTIHDPESRIQIKEVGSTVRYRCTGITRSGAGQGEVRLRWSKSGGELPYGRATDDYEGNLEIVDLRVSDSGTYVCTASDGLTSQTQFVVLQVGDVSSPPIIQISPPRFEAYEGEPIEINCIARGSPMPSLEWRRIDNETLNPQSVILNGLLRIPYATKRDEGTYECIGRNAAGSMANTVYVTIADSRPPPGPVVYITPPSTIGVIGDPVTLECGGGVSPDLEFEWRREDGRPYNAQKEGSRLVFTRARPQDTGVYLCIVRSRSTGRVIGTAQASITISISPPPVSYPTVTPEQQFVPQGQSATFKCNVPFDSYSTPSNVRWYKTSGDISPYAEYLDNGRTLRIRQLRFEDRGIYVCYAVYRGRAYNISAMLEVDRREAPRIELYPSDRRQILTVGNSLLLQCRVEGIPTPSITWLRGDNSSLPPHIVPSNSGIIRFTQVRLSDAGEYICIAENSAGRNTASAFIEVQSPPEIRVFPKDTVNLVAGENLDLTCIAEGLPTPTVQWTRRDPYDQSLLAIDNEVTARANLGRAEYQAFQVTREDEGVYWCIAQNDARREVKSVQVYVDDNRSPEDEDFWVAKGGNTQITCALESGRNLERQWVRADRNPFPSGVSQRDGTLYIRGATSAAQGEYICQLFDEQGRVQKKVGKFLTVKEPPEISLYPPRQVVRPGEDAEIRCSARGEQPIDITWESARPLPSNVLVSGGLLSFRGITEGDAGRYICKAKNIAGLSEAAADVIVNDNVASRPRVTVIGDKSRATVQGSSVTLQCTSDYPNQIGWSRSQGALPSSALIEGDTIRIRNIQPYHAGRYICSVRTPAGVIGSDYVDITVTRDGSCPGGFQCRSGECIDANLQCDNVPNCADRSDELYCPRIRRGAAHVSLKIEPSIDIIRVGSTLDLRCITENIPSSSIKWAKLGEEGLGANVKTISTNILRIEDVTTSNAGPYRCSAQTDSGTYTDDYILKVQDNSLSDSPPPAAKTISLKLGQTADVTCTNDLEPPVTYSWLRQGGLPSNAEQQEGKLTLKDVSPKDAGLYTCVASNGEVRMEIPTFVVVRGIIPKFNSKSYIKLKTLFDAYMQFDIEILFKPEDPNGLILYNGQQSSTSGASSDFVSFGLRNGYPELRFDMGSGHATIVGRSPLPMGTWVKAKLNRNRKEGRLVINDEDPVIGTSQGRHQGLDLNLPLYLGSVPDFSEISRSAEFNTGFKGCISRLVIKNEEQNLTASGALEWVDILDCEGCSEHTCTNSGACQEAANSRGYLCLCPKGFSGENCDRTGESCYPGLCGDGYCENTERDYVCKCPLGLIGSNCEHRIAIRTPSFDGASYIAYSAPPDTAKIDITLKLNPADSRDALILYAPQNDFGTGNYLSISIKDRRLEFRIDTGSGGPMVLKSNSEIIPGSWMTVTAGRDRGEARLSIGHDLSRTTLTAGQKKELLLGTSLYLGGFDTSTGSVNPSLGVSDGFRGCISHIEISRMDLHILRSAKESSNVGECSSGNPCRDSPCRNGATCVPEGSKYFCQCTSDYTGRNCEKVKDDCERYSPCGGKGECVPLTGGRGFKCRCVKGYSGQNCTIREFITTSFSAEGDGWVELPKELSDVKDSTEVELNIVTSRPEGILLWHGQPPTTAGGITDFFSIALVEGHVEVVFELGSGLGRVVSESRVDDGQPHQILVSRNANFAILTVDEKMFEGQSEGILSKLNAEGNIYIGGLPDPRYMTNGRYLENFNGCIRNIRMQNSDILDVSNSAISTVNLRRCPVTAK